MCVFLGQPRAMGNGAVPVYSSVLCLTVLLATGILTAMCGNEINPFVCAGFLQGEPRGECSEGAEVHFGRSPDVGCGEPGAQEVLHAPSPQPWPKHPKLKCAGDDL